LIQVLLAVRNIPCVVVRRALKTAVEAGWESPDAVVFEARCLAEDRPRPPQPVAVSVTARVTGPEERVLPTLGAYDELLTGVTA
jgi:hypothetical protein